MICETRHNSAWQNETFAFSNKTKSCHSPIRFFNMKFLVNLWLNLNEFGKARRFNINQWIFCRWEVLVQPNWLQRIGFFPGVNLFNLAYLFTFFGSVIYGIGCVSHWTWSLPNHSPNFCTFFPTGKWFDALFQWFKGGGHIIAPVCNDFDNFLQNGPISVSQKRVWGTLSGISEWLEQK